MNAVVKSLFQQQLQVATTRAPVAIHFIPSSERQVAKVQDTLLNFTFECFPLMLDEPALESQQQDKAVQDAIDKEVGQILAMPKIKTGAVNVFMLDSSKIAALDPDSQHMLAAATTSAMQDPSKTVLALLPVASTHPGAKEALESFSSTFGGHLVDSMEALQSVLETITMSNGVEG